MGVATSGHVILLEVSTIVRHGNVCPSTTRHEACDDAVSSDDSAACEYVARSYRIGDGSRDSLAISLWGPIFQACDFRPNERGRILNLRPLRR